MFKKLFEKLVKAHDTYKDMRRERDIAVNKFRILTGEYTDLNERLNLSYKDNAKQYKTVVKYANKIIKLVKTLEQNETTKEIKKLCNEVKKSV